MSYYPNSVFVPSEAETGPAGGLPSRREFDRAACRFFKEFSGDPPAIGLHEFLARFERAIVFNTLTEMDGCQRRAARFLKLKNTTLNRKVKVQQIHFIKTPV